MASDSSEAHRFACEVRHIWNACRGNAQKIRSMLDRIERKRGAGSTEKLRIELRKLYQAGKP